MGLNSITAGEASCAGAPGFVEGSMVALSRRQVPVGRAEWKPLLSGYCDLLGSYEVVTKGLL